MKKLVSIIMPIYPKCGFASDLFVDTVNSIMSQTYKNIEFIPVIDGGGDVRNIKLVKGIMDKYKIKYYEFNKNYGAQAAMNFGFLQSSGEYVAFHDQDDISREDRIDILYENIGDHDAAGSYINVIKPGKIRIKGFDQDLILEKYEKNGIVNPPAHFGSLIVRRDVFLDVGGFESVLTSDSLFCIKLNLLRYFGYGKKIKMVEEPLFTWIRHAKANTINKKAFTKSSKQTREFISKAYEQVVSSAGNPKKIKKILQIKDNISGARKCGIKQK